MMDGNCPRASDRVRYAARLLVLRGDKAWLVTVRDLSTGGCGVFRPDKCDLEAEQIVQLFFLIEDNAPAVSVSARVARVTARQIGFEYHEPQAVPPSAAPR